MNPDIRPVVVMLILTVLASAAAGWAYLENRNTRTELSQAKRDVDSAAAVIGNAYRTMTIFNQISAERTREKETDRQQGERERVALRQAVADDRCAAGVVPADAERRLFDKKDRVRARAVPAPAGGAVSANGGA